MKVKINGKKLGQAIVWFCFFLSLLLGEGFEYGDGNVGFLRASCMLLITIFFAYRFQKCLGEAIK
jgi:hypothetical protein